MSRAFVISYDPGGIGSHGVAVLEVREGNGRWIPVGLDMKPSYTLQDPRVWLEVTYPGSRHGLRPGRSSCDISPAAKPPSRLVP